VDWLSILIPGAVVRIILGIATRGPVWSGDSCSVRGGSRISPPPTIETPQSMYGRNIRKLRAHVWLGWYLREKFANREYMYGSYGTCETNQDTVDAFNWSTPMLALYMYNQSILLLCIYLSNGMLLPTSDARSTTLEN
jgi:hypothetical protein